jgi:hypothetical protein
MGDGSNLLAPANETRRAAHFCFTPFFAKFFKGLNTGNVLLFGIHCRQKNHGDIFLA